MKKGQKNMGRGAQGAKGTKGVLLAALLVVGALSVAGCAAFDPYVDTRREAGTTGTVGRSTPSKVSICYNSVGTSADEVKKMADDECAKTGKKAAFLGQNYWDCTLFVPTRIEYLCQ